MKQTKKTSLSPGIAQSVDITVLYAGVVLIFLTIITSSRLNISADSVDYYAILQKMTDKNAQPIVQNLHFADQRSPGYCILSMAPYYAIDFFIEPLVETKKITEYETLPPRSPNVEKHHQEIMASSRTMSGEEFPLLQPPHGNGPPVGGPGQHEMSSEFAGIPPIQLKVSNLLFNDYFIEGQGSWYQWKIALAMLLTSLLFLAIGFTFNILTLKLLFSKVKGFALIPIAMFVSPVFMKNLVDFPLYATMTVYGLSSAFLYFLLKSDRDQNPRYFFMSGLSFGFLVLTRMELVILIIPLFVFLIFGKNFKHLLAVVYGGIFPLLILMGYNLLFHGTPFDLSILKGDINILTVNFSFILDNLFHPDSGILFWSPVLLPGLLILVLSGDRINRIAGISAFLVLGLYLMKIPVMYFHLGEGAMDIGGIPINVPPNAQAMRFLIRSDINRYVIVLLPFAVTGVGLGMHKLLQRLNKQTKSTENFI